MASIPIGLAALFEAIGPQTDAIDWVSFDVDSASWTVRFDDDAVLLLAWDGELEHLMVQSLLGRPAEHAMVAVYQAVLAYNASWQDNGGARIGMVDADGELALMFDVPAHGLTLEQLQRVLLGVRSVAAAWVRCVADPAGEEQVPAVALQQHLNRV